PNAPRGPPPGGARPPPMARRPQLAWRLLKHWTAARPDPSPPTTMRRWCGTRARPRASTMAATGLSLYHDTHRRRDGSKHGHGRVHGPCVRLVDCESCKTINNVQGEMNMAERQLQLRTAVSGGSRWRSWLVGAIAAVVMAAGVVVGPVPAHADLTLDMV